MNRLLKVSFIFIILFSSYKEALSQNDEASLYSSTKQINQFFRRFNCEEAPDGTRYYEKDKFYHDAHKRQQYLNILFDKENPNITGGLMNNFIADISNKTNPFYLEFHGGKWFAQAEAIFNWLGREEHITLFLKLQEENVGSKWVIYRINSLALHNYFDKDTTNKRFLHPLSHEVDFMNLQKAFDENRSHIEDYTFRGYQPDYLSLFLYEVKKGNITFKEVQHVKFHFFQLNNWYFEVSDFNRSGYNTGWLISNLVRANDKEKNILRQYIYNQGQ